MGIDLLVIRGCRLILIKYIKILISKEFLREVSSRPTDPTKYYEASYDSNLLSLDVFS